MKRRRREGGRGEREGPRLRIPRTHNPARGFSFPPCLLNYLLYDHLFIPCLILQLLGPPLPEHTLDSSGEGGDLVSKGGQAHHPLPHHVTEQKACDPAGTDLGSNSSIATF